MKFVLKVVNVNLICFSPAIFNCVGAGMEVFILKGLGLCQEYSKGRKITRELREGIIILECGI